MTTSLRKRFTPLVDILEGRVPLGAVAIAGWIRTRRASKKVAFLEINDGTCAQSLQVVVGTDNHSYQALLTQLQTGAAVAAQGTLVESLGQGQKWELQATALEVFGAADPNDYPLQKKEATWEFLRDVAHLRVRTSTFASMFRLRSFLSQKIHGFFAERGFCYVHTPLITTSDGEGAGETFQVTHLDLTKVPRRSDGSVDYSKDFFGEPAMLAVTGQLEGELLAMGLNKIYTFGPTFRAENSQTSRHLSEFWMIEPEMAFYNLEDNMCLAQDFIQHLIEASLTGAASDLAVLAAKADGDPRPHLESCLGKDFARISYTEAVELLQKSGRNFEFPVFWGADLKSEHERYLCEEYVKGPVIVYNYPESLKAFYMYLNDDRRTVAAMDVLVPGIGEVIGGSQREDRESVLRERMAAKNISVDHMQWYLDIRRFGSVPHAGFGLGLERLCMWVSGMGNIRDVIPFPRAPGQCRY